MGSVAMVETDVVVVGAGPTGAALAGALGTLGVRCVLLESSDGAMFDPRLHAVNIRTMELARRWGITDELRHCGWPLDHSQDIVYITSVQGQELGRIRWPAISEMAPPPESPTFAQRCPQTWFNAILQRFAGRQASVQSVFLNRMERFEQDSDGVTVWIRDMATGREWRARAAYLVGCDGAQSQVREQLGIERTFASKLGHSAEIVFRSPALAQMNGAQEAGRYNIVHAAGLSRSLLPIDGQGLYRMTLIAEGAKVDKPYIVTAIRESIGDGVDFELVNDVIPWVSGVTSAQRFRSGRVFLAGDAAHTMPTTGGMGMNTGILDAFDLSWKLEASCRGWGGARLLESYEIERRQAADRTSLMASDIYRDWLKMEPELRKAGHLLSEDSAQGIACRERLGEELVRVFRREFNSIGGSLGYRYNGSPICIPDGSQEPEDSLSFYIPTSRPGHRAPHVWLGHECSTLDLFGQGFCVLAHDSFEMAAANPLVDAARTLGIPAKLYVIPNPTWHLFPCPLTIVRPDGHVAWRGDPPSDAMSIWLTLTGR